MQIVRFPDKWSVKKMCSVAILVSIPWAFWATFWTFFLLVHLFGEGGFLSKAVFLIIMIIVALMYFGAVIIASLWEGSFGGDLLLADGVLILAFLFFFGCLTGEPLAFLIGGGLIFITMVLPPLVAGSLFQECHRRSKTSAEQP